MSSVDATLPSPGALLAPADVTERFRVLALLSGLVLVGSFLSVFYYVTDIAGGTLWLLVVVGLSFVAATKVADRVDERTATAVATLLFVGGISVYLAAVPQVVDELLDVDFLRALFTYTTGVSVLQFLRVDVWAIGLAPAPTFLAWYLLLRRRYAAGAVVGSLTLGFFAFTDDASATVLLLGVLGMFGTLAFGTLERVDGNWKHAERLGLVAVLVVIAARTIDVLPEGGSTLGDGIGAPTLEASLLRADEQLEVLGSLTLSPEVRFTIEADQPGYWRAGAYDRYTGDSWIRTGNASPYRNEQPSPPGASRSVRQRVSVETELHAMPAMWKPIRVEDAGIDVDVTDLGGFVPSGSFAKGEEYEVVSAAPARNAATLREAGEDYPSEITDRYLDVPNSLPDRVAEHAEAITREADTAFDSAIAIEGWLNANKGYSLNVDKPGGDVVDGFLFNRESGYCVYFASAMTVMLRTLDVPARFAVGYTTGQRIDEGEWVVRGLNSHAWTEVYFPGVGWIPFDPTPTGARSSRRRQRIQVAREHNESNVDVPGSRGGGGSGSGTPTPTQTVGEITVTQPEREMTGPSPTPVTPAILAPSPRGPRPAFTAGANGTLANTTTATPTETPEENSIVRFFAERDRVSILAGAVGLALGAHHFGLLDRVRTEMWLRHQSPTDSPTEDVERAFARLEHVLSRRHRERESGETPRQYVSALESEGADLDSRVRRAARIREQTRYAGEASREEADEIIEIVNDIVDAD